MILDTKKVLTEVQSIIDAIDKFDVVTLEKLTPLADEDNDLAAYIGIKAISYEPVRANVQASGYDRSIFVTIDINQNCDAPTDIIDTVDTVERAILDDSAFWQSVVLREMVGVEFDDQQFYPYRTCTLLMHALYRLED